MRSASAFAATLLAATAIAGAARADGLAQVPFLGVNGAAANLAGYLAEFRCEDPAETDPRGCISGAGAAMVRLGATPVQWRRCDWGSYAAPYYQCPDQALSDDGQYIVSTFSYGPWRQFTPSHGDGAQVITTDGLVARFTETRDGSSPDVYFFAGAGCDGGSGWVLVDENAGISDSDWTSETGALALTHDRDGCPLLAPAFDRWITQNIGYPFLVFGRAQTRNIPTIVSEHYDHATIDQSTYMERNFLGQGYGLLRWEAWENTANGQRNVAQDLGQRCPALASGPAAPPGMEMYDCRHLTQIVPAYDWTEDDFGWAP